MSTFADSLIDLTTEIILKHDEMRFRGIEETRETGRKMGAEILRVIEDCERIRPTPAQMALLDHLAGYATVLATIDYTEVGLRYALDEKRLSRLTRRVSQEFADDVC